MRCTRVWAVALAAAMAGLTLPVTAQVKEAPARAGLLAPVAVPGAVQEFRAGFDAQHLWSWTAAADHEQRALGAAPGFGLARALTARLLAGPNMAAELDRAVADAAKGTPAEAVLTMAIREAALGRPATARPLFDAAVALAPAEPGVALERALALAGEARIDALRDVSRKFIDDAASRLWLAYSLTEETWGLSRANSAEALEVAQAALRIAPNEPGAITIMAHVLERLGRFDEAGTYLDRAAEMTPTTEYAFVLRAEIALRQGKYVEAREAFNRAIAITPLATMRVAYQRAEAFMPLYEGKAKEALQQLDAIAVKAEGDGLKGDAATTHARAAFVAAAARDAATVEHELAEARRLGASGTGQDITEAIAFALAGRPTQARQAANAVEKALSGSSRQEMWSVVEGIVLVSEDKAADAVPLLRDAPLNPFAQLGLVDAYRKLGKKAEANVARDAIFARKDFPWNCTAVPMARYRFKS